MKIEKEISKYFGECNVSLNPSVNYRLKDSVTLVVSAPVGTTVTVTTSIWGGKNERTRILQF